MKKTLFLLFILVFFCINGKVFAQQYNQGCGVYGTSCPTGNLFISKTVKNPQTGEFVHTLSSNGPNFLPGQEVDFRIEVKNTGSADLTDIQVQDKLPDFVSFSSGVGNFDKNSQTLTWSIDRLHPSESRFFDIKVNIKDASTIPDQSITCLTNFSQAQKDQMVGQDTSTFCIQKILGKTPELPKTGPEETTILLLSSSSILFLTLTLRKQIKSLRGGEEH